MRVPIGLPEHHLADFEELVYQLRGYEAHNIADQLFWEKTDTEDGWRLTGPWVPNIKNGYQQVSITAKEHERLRKLTNKTRFVYLHRLVSAMVQPTPHGVPGNVSDEPTCHHIDEDKLNAAPSNIAVVTGSENTAASRPFGLGFCDRGHPIVGMNIKYGGRTNSCRYCKSESMRRRNYKTGHAKAYTPMPNFWTWMMSQYKDAADPELAMYRDTGLLVPVVI